MDNGSGDADRGRTGQRGGVALNEGASRRMPPLALSTSSMIAAEYYNW